MVDLGGSGFAGPLCGLVFVADVSGCACEINRAVVVEAVDADTVNLKEESHFVVSCGVGLFGGLYASGSVWVLASGEHEEQGEDKQFLHSGFGLSGLGDDYGWS